MSCSEKEKEYSDTIEYIHDILDAPVGSLDPLNYENMSTFRILNNIMDSYHSIDYFSDNTEDFMASLSVDTDIRISDDELTYTFEIKNNVRYYDPTEKVFVNEDRYVMAKDFIYSIMRMADRNNKHFMKYDENILGLHEWSLSTVNNTADYSAQIEGLKVLNDFEFSITLINKNSKFMDIFKEIKYAPLPREYVEQLGEDFEKTPIGSGPYYLDIQNSNIKKSRIVLKKNPYNSNFNSSKNTPKSLMGLKYPLNKGVVLSYIADKNEIYKRFLRGSIDFILSDAKMDEILLNQEGNSYLSSNTNTLNSFEPSFYGYSFNYKDPVWKDILNSENGKKIRTVFTNILDLKNNIKKFKNPNIVISKGPIGSFKYNQLNQENIFELEDSEFDFEKSKRLLEEAGYPMGKGLPKLKVSVYEKNYFDVFIWENNKDIIKSLGLDIEVEFINYNSLYEKIVKSKDYQVISFFYIMDSGGLNSVFELFKGENSLARYGYSDHIYDELYLNSLNESSFDEKVKLYYYMIQKLRNDNSFINTYYRKRNTYIYNWVENFEVRNRHIIMYKYLKVNKELKKNILGI